MFDIDIDYPKSLHDLHSDLPFLPQRMKINNCDKLKCNLYDKNNCVFHISLLKQALNHGLTLKKVHKVISFNQEAWMKDYIITNIEERKKADSEFKKDFYKRMCNAVFGKSMEQVRNHRDIRLVTTDKDLNRPLPIGKNKKVLGIMKDELCGKVMTYFCALRAKTYSYLDYDGKEEKKAKGTNKCAIKKRLNLMIIRLLCLIIIQF